MRDLETIQDLFDEASTRGVEFYQGVQIIKRAPKGVLTSDPETFDQQPLWKRALVMRGLKQKSVNVLEIRQYLRREYQRAYRRRIRDEIKMLRAARRFSESLVERLSK